MTREEAEKCAKEMTYRDAVYNVIQDKCIPYRKATLIKLYELLNVLEALPQVTPALKHGKWIKDKGDHMYHCTRCYTRWVHVDDMNYCPRCGAEMSDSKVSENPTGSD